MRPPLLIVTGATAVGKSVLCARLAGTVAGAVLLDADVHAGDLVSTVPPNEDYAAFWASMMRLAHELAQNGVAIVYFATMLPEQVLVNTDLLDYFESAQFLCLVCRPEVLRERITHRNRSDAAVSRWLDFNEALGTVARRLPMATAVDAGRALDEVERDVRDWLERTLRELNDRR